MSGRSRKRSSGGRADARRSAEPSPRMRSAKSAEGVADAPIAGCGSRSWRAGNQAAFSQGRRPGVGLVAARQAVLRRLGALVRHGVAGRVVRRRPTRWWPRRLCRPGGDGWRSQGGLSGSAPWPTRGAYERIARGTGGFFGPKSIGEQKCSDLVGSRTTAWYGKQQTYQHWSKGE